MESKILKVFYGADNLPYKDSARAVHFPIAGTGFLGASNTTQIKFYYDELDNLDETTWVAVSKLPNGKLGSRVLESYLDDELNEHYALLELDSFYTQYKGDVFISLQGYQGGVNVDYDEENSQYEIHGTPTIAATGSIKFTINYANQFVGSGETDNVNFQRILADLGTKLGMRAYSEHVEELPSEGSPDVFYVVNDDPNNPNLANIYVWNENTRHYIWVGDNTLDLGEYYTKTQGNLFEENIENRVENVEEGLSAAENQIDSLASGSPSGIYATVADLTAAHPTGDNKIYLVSADGHWYYWNGSAWTDGGVYLSTGNAVPDTRKIAGIDLVDDITDTELETALTILDRNNNKFDFTYCKNMIGEDAGDDVLYPCYIKAGTPCTIFTSDGSGFSVGNRLNIFRANGTQIDYYSLTVGATGRTFWSGFAEDVYFVSVRYKNAVPLQFQLGTVQENYVKYFKNPKYSYQETFENTQNIKVLNKSTLNINNEIALANYKVDYTTGYLSTSDDWNITKYFEIKKDDVIYYELNGVNATASALAYYDTSKVYSSANSVVSASGLKKGYFVAPNDGYVRFTINSNNNKVVFVGNIPNYIYCQKNLNVPYYWLNQLQTKKQTIESNRITCGSNIVEFFFITDTHFKYNAKKSPFLINWLSQETENYNVIFGGDEISGYNSSKTGAEEELRELYVNFDRNLNFISNIGNHDLNSNGNSDTSLYLSLSEVYPIMNKRAERECLLEKTFNNTIYDNKSQKVRFINIYRPYDSALTNEQKSWIIDRITELPSGWNVIFFSHAFWSSADYGDPLVTSAQGKADADFLSDLCAANNITNIAWFVGHTHRDYNETITSSLGNKMVVICTMTDAYAYGNSESGFSMTLGTDTEQAFDFVQIDTYNKKIYTTRIGAGNNREIDYGD